MPCIVWTQCRPGTGAVDMEHQQKRQQRQQQQQQCCQHDKIDKIARLQAWHPPRRRPSGSSLCCFSSVSSRHLLIRPNLHCCHFEKTSLMLGCCLSEGGSRCKWLASLSATPCLCKQGAALDLILLTLRPLPLPLTNGLQTCDASSARAAELPSIE